MKNEMTWKKLKWQRLFVEITDGKWNAIGPTQTQCSVNRIQCRRTCRPIRWLAYFSRNDVQNPVTQTISGTTTINSCNSQTKFHSQSYRCLHPVSVYESYGVSTYVSFSLFCLSNHTRFTVVQIIEEALERKCFKMRPKSICSTQVNTTCNTVKKSLKV